jgi:hypothetical protein
MIHLLSNEREDDFEDTFGDFSHASLTKKVIFRPFLLRCSKKENFRLFWAFYSLCCIQYWSFDLPAEVFENSNSDYFDEKNSLIISFSLKEFLCQAGLSNDSKNKKLAVTFFQNLDSFAETEAYEHSEKEYFSFSNLVVDFKRKRDKLGIYFEIELDPRLLLQVFNPSTSGISYRVEIWAEFLKYAQQAGFTVKQMDVYMQSFFLFYSSLFRMENGFYNFVPFLELKESVDPVIKNSTESKENKAKTKIYLMMVCFIQNHCGFSTIILVLDGKVISSGKAEKELLSMVDIPFQEIYLKNDY